MTITEKFRKSLEEGYKKYLSVHPRSNEKILPIHQCISEIIFEKLVREDTKFSIKSLGIDDNREYNFKGKYYSKDIDITVLYENKPISGIGFKFITSNYKQNSNNYFENMLGETANLRRADFLYGNILVFKHKMPYYSSDKKTFTKIEHINEKNILKYVKLHNDNIPLLYHKPDIIFLTFIETGDEKEFEKIVKLYELKTPKKIDKSHFHKNQIDKVKIKFIGYDQLSKKDFSQETLEFIRKVSNFESFINAFVNSTKGRIYGR